MEEVGNLKIDIVYLWVDGADLKYQEIKNETRKKLGMLGQANEKCRFIDNDELKYSLRSLEKYASWINKIFIVTNNQVPKWLNLDNSKITIVDHKEIMPKESMPCFNSNAIEHCLINIPNLSEYFLCANDDTFFVDYVIPEFFFKNLKPIYRYNDFYEKNENLYNQFLANSEELVFKKYGKRYNRYPHHNIEPYLKSSVSACYNEFKKEIDNTIFSQFRLKTDIQKSIYANYALATNNAYMKIISRIDSWLPWYKKIINRIFKNYSKDSIDVSASNDNIMWHIKKYKPKLFCINDDELTTDNDRMRVKEILEELFPEKSEFER
ncbi:MAG: Stealth CR1 domain-containing protein [Candidatus Gastranaerophilales bacterium]|nr:Stealth CR1 domain-containing protein [Candidatus Gastranaerophilales bacterium]